MALWVVGAQMPKSDKDYELTLTKRNSGMGIFEINKYIENRENLVCLFVLIDSRLEPQKIDLEFIDSLGKKQIPFALVFTKTDKLNKIKLSNNLEIFRKTMLEKWEELPREFITSSEKVIGRDDILNYIDELNKLYNEKK